MKTSFYQGGWRPALGWLAVVVVCFWFVVFPLVGMVASGFKLILTIPSIDVPALMTLLTATTTVAGMRSFDKLKQTDTKELI